MLQQSLKKILQAPAPGRRASKVSWLRRGGTLAMAALSLGLIYLSIFDKDGLAAYLQKRRAVLRQQQQIRALQQENQRLAEHNQRLENDPDVIEHAAREQLHYTRPGEIIYILPKAPHSTAPGPSQEQTK